MLRPGFKSLFFCFALAALLGLQMLCSPANRAIAKPNHKLLHDEFAFDELSKTIPSEMTFSYLATGEVGMVSYHIDYSLIHRPKLKQYEIVDKLLKRSEKKPSPLRLSQNFYQPLFKAITKSEWLPGEFYTSTIIRMHATVNWQLHFSYANGQSFKLSSNTAFPLHDPPEIGIWNLMVNQEKFHVEYNQEIDKAVVAIFHQLTGTKPCL